MYNICIKHCNKRTIKDNKIVLPGKFSYIFSVKRNFLSSALKVGSIGACVTVGG